MDWITKIGKAHKLMTLLLVAMVFLCVAGRQSRADYVSEFVPPRIDTDMVAWFRADGVGTVTKDGSDNVSAWADESGNGNDATSVAVKPVWMAAEINGEPIIRFSSGTGASSTMMQTGPGVLGRITDLTVFAVAKHRTVTNKSSIVSASNGGYTSTHGWFYLGLKRDLGDFITKNSAYLTYGPGSTPVEGYIGVGDPNFHLTGFTWQGDFAANTADYDFHVDDTNITGTCTSWMGEFQDNLDLGGWDDVGVYKSFGNVDIAEILVWRAVLSAKDIAKVKGYLLQKYWNIEYLYSDVDDSGEVNAGDLKVGADSWLECTDPNRPVECP